MNPDGLFKILSAIHPLSEAFKRAIETELISLSLPKNHLLLQAPSISEHVYFLDRGFAITYTFTKERKQIEWFWPSGQIIFSAKSFFEQVPTQEYIQLISPSEVLCVSYAGVLRLFDLYPEAHFIYRVIMNQYYEHSRERIHDLQYLNTYARYTKLITRYSRIEQMVSQEYIASYLGITPQSLSRIKRQENHS